MQPARGQPESAAENLVAGYFAGVTTGSLVFVLLAMLRGASAGFESSTDFSLALKAVHFSGMAIFFFVLTWIIAAGVMALPCAALSLIVHQFKIANWFFYLIAGIALGCLAAFASVEPFKSFHWYTDPPDEVYPTPLQAMFNVCGFSVPAGAAAGMVCWRVLGRYYRSSNAK